MVNGNYALYGDRPSSGSEVVDDHIHSRTAERKLKRKFRSSEQINSLRKGTMLQRNNETDSFKNEKAKEPRLLRYIPTTEIEEHYITETFETYDLKPTCEELPRRQSYTKKPKNPADGSANYCNSRSSSSCSSPTANLPTISEYGENYGTYRIRSMQSFAGTESKLEKYFCEPRDFPKGTHPDSLYRVPTSESTRIERAMRLMRLLRWPAALILTCIALGLFVYFLVPYKSMMFMDEDLVNETEWETVQASMIGHRHNKNPYLHKQQPASKSTEPPLNRVSDSRTPEIDFYESDNNNNEPTNIKILSEVLNGGKVPAKPVFPEHIEPEIQYGADEHTLRKSKLLEDGSNAIKESQSNEIQRSTAKPHITLTPETPSVIEPHIVDAPQYPNPSKYSIIQPYHPALKKVYPKLANYSSNRQTTLHTDIVGDLNSYIKQLSIRNEKPNHIRNSATTPNVDEAETIIIPTTEPKDQVSQEEVRPSDVNAENVNVKFTSGHSKIFGIGIEDVASLQSSTQSSTYKTRVSPTLPTWRDDTTTKNYPTTNVDVYQCRSTKLHICRGILPYDLTSQPAQLNGIEITSYLPQIEYLVTTNCSNRIRQFFCALLEPECSPYLHPPKLPCYNLCQAIKDSCDEFMPQELLPAFNCRQYARDNCIAAHSPCRNNEFKCGDDTCILKDWVCDGTLDCPAGEDEKACAACAKNEFSCESGGCIAKQWLCDGYRDCPAGEDELETTCKGQTESGRGEPGEDAAGSAPALSVRRPHRFIDSQKRIDDQKIEDTDSSKELLMTSDSSNGLKRNYMRRPSPARLSPYTPKLRQNQQLDMGTEETVIKTTEYANAQETTEEATTQMIEEIVVQGDNSDKSLEPLTGLIIVNNDTENSESYADYARSYTSHSSPCPSGELRCVDGRCITFTQLCDGIVDCSDKADERNCYS